MNTSPPISPSIAKIKCLSAIEEIKTNNIFLEIPYLWDI
jgi:hypothetical protein